MSKKNDTTRDIFKRDRRRSFDGAVDINRVIVDAIENAPDEYFQSLFAAYPEASKSITLVSPKLRSENCRELWITPKENTMLDPLVSRATSLMYSLGDEKVYEYVASLPDGFKKIYGISEQEYNVLRHEPNFYYILQGLIRLQVMRFLGGKTSIDSKDKVEFLKSVLGDNTDLWVKISTYGKFERMSQIDRLVPASEEFGTPELSIHLRWW